MPNTVPITLHDFGKPLTVASLIKFLWGLPPASTIYLGQLDKATNRIADGTPCVAVFYEPGSPEHKNDVWLMPDGE